MKFPFSLLSMVLATTVFLGACSDDKKEPVSVGTEVTAPAAPPEPVKAPEPAPAPAPAPAPVATVEAPAPAPAPAPLAPAEVKEVKEVASVAPVAAVTSPENQPMKEGNAVAKGKELATIGGGCFWCTEAVIEKLEGVSDVVSGYMGGQVDNPTYEQICTKTTGHAEVIQITFDPSVITFSEILDVFWQAHDPTTLNQQGADRGPQYRSVIYYHSPEQKMIALESIKKLNESAVYPDPAVTEVTEAAKFWVAEDYHQDYYRLNKDKNPYCRVVISPKMKKLGFE
jgi:peptide-methionine (S)-S-oxide reductase